MGQACVTAAPLWWRDTALREGLPDPQTPHDVGPGPCVVRIVEDLQLLPATKEVKQSDMALLDHAAMTTAAKTLNDSRNGVAMKEQAIH
ncbi:hypothetical protein NDU88_004487 [Pleurodeles waltl]|uniref:Uncharacterized protein n=1 Tax=Pleurodeles waltl TaxID=8319 RepID=A0AAV7LLI0_PLEWA|nr:hypothetical protein NDU88_004487 [Pleurodeles waltl]